MKNKPIIVGILLTIVILGIGVFLLSDKKTLNLDGFAKCLKDKGAVFYGAFWCPHCQNQKKLFGQSEKYLPYVECSTPDGKNQLPACKNKKINGYPTWEFADKTRLNGEVALEVLAQKTSCPLPK